METTTRCLELAKMCSWDGAASLYIGLPIDERRKVIVALARHSDSTGQRDGIWWVENMEAAVEKAANRKDTAESH